MRLKTSPEDFRVRELLEWPEVADGPFVVHKLHKAKLSTTEALSLLAREAKVDRAGIAYAGLKDRQAVTDQFITIERQAVRVDLPNLRVEPVGATDRPITSKQSQGNAFAIVIRDLQPTEASRLRRSLPSLVATGFPNYFDDQRFGCLRHGQGFAMESVLHGDYERALQQFVAEPSPVAITGDVKLKKAIQLRWGDWETCANMARGPVYEPLFQHLLRRPDDFRGALEHVPLRQRVISAFAYQSFLWNRAVSQLLHRGIDSAQRLRIRTLAGDVMAWKYLAPERETRLVAMQTPLYGPDGDGGSAPFRSSMARQLENAGLAREDFLRNEVPGMIWREEPRDVFVKPRDVADVKIAPDEVHPGRVRAELAFALPRGAYATMLIKRLFAPSWYERGERRDRAGGRERPREERDHD
ncbi:MAG: tRNA pseudouridine(13) synthase TruD [Planctomycetes bacterium]|nr:tRNA pseudouridine(13) synthase TruD [Planctomycetota bacterium]